jgi:hypothetical protein
MASCLVSGGVRGTGAHLAEGGGGFEHMGVVGGARYPHALAHHHLDCVENLVDKGGWRPGAHPGARATSRTRRTGQARRARRCRRRRLRPLPVHRSKTSGSWGWKQQGGKRAGDATAGGRRAAGSISGSPSGSNNQTAREEAAHAGCLQGASSQPRLEAAKQREQQAEHAATSTRLLRAEHNASCPALPRRL